MRIGALLTANAKTRTTIDRSATVADAAAKMKHPHMRALVVTSGDQPVGIVTRRDFFERVIARELSPCTPLAEVMSADPVTASSELAIEEALELMNRHKIRHLAVLDPDGTTSGVIGIEILAGWIAADREARIGDLVYYITHG